ncbi:hypothetical protein Cni_G08003 [Canna indica]|uniref:CCT domain-containing protein n=1 Tax=Canna indica TaxID=4628 RepID=A0AAQ3K028_9LILI|nr:hypothetical protein Cni_G08003 [Canna indica]
MFTKAGLQLPAISQSSFSWEADHHGQYCARLQLLDEDFLSPYHLDGGYCLVNCNMVQQSPTVSEYDMGGEGDLFKAPEAILEEPPALELDPMAAAISIMSCGGDASTVAEMESIQDDHLTDVFFECKKDLLENTEIEDSFSQLLDAKTPAAQIDEFGPMEKLGYVEGSIQKSVSSECLKMVPTYNMGPDFLDLQGLDLEVALGLRRAYSEGDIQNLGFKDTTIGNRSSVCSSFEQFPAISDLKMERQHKLSRYREKKSRRNFGKKIKYACRKALADSQPRVHGRFARTEEREARNQTYKHKHQTRLC